MMQIKRKMINIADIVIEDKRWSPHLGFGAAFEQLFGGLVDMKTSDIRDKQLRINTAGGAAFAELHMS